MKFVVSTCDKYISVVEALKYTFDKCGGKDYEVVVLGFKEPKFDLGSWEFYSLGTDTGPGNLSNDLWRFFESFNDEYFVWLNDDIVIVDELDKDLLTDMVKIMDTDKNVGRICVTSATKAHYINYPVYKEEATFDYREVPQNAEYRLSLNSSLWRTSYFKKYCQQGAGNWIWETRPDALNDGATILGTIGRYFIDFGHIFRYGNMSLSHNWYESEYTDKKLSDTDLNHVLDILHKTYNP